MVILSREETAELFKQRPKEYEGGFISIPLGSRKSASPEWPGRGYVLARNNGQTLWPYLEDSLVRDCYEALSVKQLKENSDVR